MPIILLHMMLMNKICVVNSNMSHLIGTSDSNLMFKRTGSMSVKQVNYNFLHQMRLSLFFQLTLFCTSFIYYIKKLKIDFFFFSKKENHLNLKALLFLVLGQSLEWCWCKMVKEDKTKDLDLASIQKQGNVPPKVFSIYTT